MSSKLLSLFTACLLFIVGGSAWAQDADVVTLYNETFGTTTSNVSADSYKGFSSTLIKPVFNSTWKIYARQNCTVTGSSKEANLGSSTKGAYVLLNFQDIFKDCSDVTISFNYFKPSGKVLICRYLSS